MKNQIITVLLLACLNINAQAAETITHKNCEIFLSQEDSYGFVSNRRWGVDDRSSLSAKWTQDEVDILWNKGFRPRLDSPSDQAAHLALNQDIFGSYSNCYVKISISAHEKNYGTRTLVKKEINEHWTAKSDPGFFSECRSTRERFLLKELPACKVNTGNSGNKADEEISIQSVQ